MQSTKSAPGVATPVISLVVGVILVIVGQFFLDHLADTSDTWHYIQHGVLFAGGLLVGAAVLLLYQRGQQRV
jgi:protein-S-isoprenylcysteine O-methyltransferase Ste14